MRTLAKLGYLDELTKEAIISAQQHATELAADEARALQLAKMRGIPVPMKDIPISMEGGIPIYESRPDVANMRMGPRDIGAARAPGAPIGTTPGASPLQEAEYLKGQSTNFGSTTKKLKHRWLNPARRFMGTTGGKILGVGALGAAGLGLYSYLKNRRTPQPEQYQLSPEEQMMMQQQMYGMAPKTGAEGGNPGVTVPRPAPVPRIRPSGPAVANLPQKTRDSAAIGEEMATATPGQDKSTRFKKADIDPSIAALLAGGAGGAGGYLLGSQILSPLLEKQEKGIAEEILKKQRSAELLKHVRKATPIGMAALGAVTLAAVAAAKARADERQKVNLQHILAGRLQPYDQTGAGFGAADQVPFGAPYDKVYG